jgi:hypothetical protein
LTRLAETIQNLGQNEFFRRTVSHRLYLSRDARDVAADAARAIQVARSALGQIASLVLAG